jgi:hypothetical protein
LGTPPAGTPPPANGSPTGSEPPAGSGDPWYKAHVKDADNLKTIETKKWDGVEAVVKSYRELETAFSQKGAASQAPADPKEYTFNVPDEMKSGYNQAFAEKFRAIAHKAGVSKEAAAAIHDGFLDYAKAELAAQSTKSSEDLQKTVTTAQAALEQAWGAQITPAFGRNVEMAKRAINNLDAGLKQELIDMGAIVKVGNDEMIAKPAIFKALAKAGGQLFAEDTLYGTATSGINPFDPKTENLGMQNQIVKTDPAKAKLLIRAAGLGNAPQWQHFLNP